MEEQRRQSNPVSGEGFLTRLKRLASDRRGVGAVEFALIAPLLLSLYITSFEITVGLSVSKRVTRTASTIADLVTRETSVDTTFLATMGNVMSSMFAPYTASNPNIRVTGVTLDASGKATVAWSWGSQNGKAYKPYVVGSAVTVPSEMQTANTFLVRAEVAVDHQLLMFMSGLIPPQANTISIGRDYFYRQRLGSNVACTNC